MSLTKKKLKTALKRSGKIEQKVHTDFLKCIDYQLIKVTESISTQLITIQTKMACDAHLYYKHSFLKRRGDCAGRW